ncbi:uncharacterized protein RBU57_007879 isoform 2-T2 [Macrochelys suwanniensis]
MVRLSGKVPSDQSSGHRSRLSRESRHSRHRHRRRFQSSRSYRSRSRHGRRHSRSSSRSSRHREEDSRKRSPTPHRRGHRRRSISRSSSSRRYRTSSSESRSRGRRHRRRRSYRSHGTDRTAFTPAVSHSRASAFQPDQLVPPVPQQGQWQGVPWQGQWCQWTPWPPGHAQPDTRSVAGASEAPSATISRAPRPRSADPGSSAPNADSEQGVEPTVPADALSSVPASSPVPEDKVAAPPPSVPKEDYRAHQELLKRVASNLQLQAEEMEGPSDSLFNVLSSSAPGRVALPLHEGVANITKALWHTPASLVPISRKAERKYFVLTKGHKFLYTHPAPNSLVVESVNHRERQGQPGPTPKNKDSKRLDSFGRKLYSSSSFQLRVANHQALLSRYNFNLWGSLQKFEPFLPERERKEFKALVEEQAAAAKVALQAASDAADTAARSIASAVSMRRASSFLLSGLSSEAQSVMQDLPFDGKDLFAEQTDVRLHGMKDSHTTLQTLGLYVLPAKEKPKPQAPAQAPQPHYEPASRGPGHKRGDLNGCPALPRSLGPPGASSRASGGFDWGQEGTRVHPEDTLRQIKLAFSNRLRPFLSQWSHITSDRWVLSTIARGYTLQFRSPPISRPPPGHGTVDPSHLPLLQQEVGRLLSLGAIEGVPREFQGKGFCSRYFLIPKAKGGLRPILDLRGLNRFMVKY